MSVHNYTEEQQEFKLVDFKKQIKEFLINKTELVVNYRESLGDEVVTLKSKISKFNITEDIDNYVLNATFRNKRSISVVLPKDKVIINTLISIDEEKLYIYEARADEAGVLLGIGFTVEPIDINKK